jgi:hypothetical protein
MGALAPSALPMTTSALGRGARAANHTILVGHSNLIGGVIRSLQIPTTQEGGETVWDPAGTWGWTEPFANTGAQVTSPDNVLYENGKWAVVDDMGDGRGAIVVVNSLTGPTYVY